MGQIESKNGAPPWIVSSGVGNDAPGGQMFQHVNDGEGVFQ
jgi:hypothetical protein